MKRNMQYLIVLKFLQEFETSINTVVPELILLLRIKFVVFYVLWSLQPCLFPDIRHLLYILVVMEAEVIF